MRGKRAVGTFYLYNPGITPAGAGKTNKRWLCIAIAQDHPRRCGENFAGKNPYRAALGSPPQVRGKRTPCRLAMTNRKDHPRRCGENVKKKLLAPYAAGSPPQVRGKRRLKIEIVPCCGITPAGAGKTDFTYALQHLR